MYQSWNSKISWSCVPQQLRVLDSGHFVANVLEDSSGEGQTYFLNIKY